MSYHPNGMVNQVGHGNLVTDTYGKDPNDMGRPYWISSSNALSNWDSGRFEYDGAGNIKALRGMLEPVARPAPTRQQYTYDAFSNLQRIDLNGVTYQDLATSTSTNRLNASGFDASGNMTTWGGYTYGYDPLNAMATLQGTGIKRQHLYDAEGERAAVKDVNNPTTPVTTFSLRGLDGKVLREYVLTGSAWSWGKDYVYRNGQLLAAIDANGTKHFTLDHLGSPRLITDASRNVVEYHAYWGYGQEIDTAVGTERMKFTGHERDNQCSAGMLDYMHARYYNPTIGRFLAVDQGNGKPEAPGSWNRYGYAQGNPANLVDPDGEAVLPAAALGAAAGGVFGFAGSVLAQAYRNDWSFAAVNWRAAGAAAAGGALSGALFGATMGLSALAEAGVGTTAVVGAGSNVVGNAVTRGIDADPGTQAANLGDLAWDAGGGAIGGAFGAAVRQAFRATLPQVEAQILASTPAARAGDWGASQAVRGHLAKAFSLSLRAELAGSIVGAKVTSVITPLVRARLQKEREDEKKFRLFRTTDRPTLQ